MNDDDMNVSVECEVHDAGALFLRREIGTAKAGDGTEYELSLANMITPLIRSKKTGKWVTFSWPALIDAAIAAGIDKE
jgi:hypothetical protein